MKTKEIKDLTDKQIRETIAEEKMNLTKMTLSHAVSPLENPMRMEQTKRLIARLKTEQRKRQLTTSQSAK